MLIEMRVQVESVERDARPGDGSRLQRQVRVEMGETPGEIRPRIAGHDRVRGWQPGVKHEAVEREIRREQRPRAKGQADGAPLRVLRRACRAGRRARSVPERSPPFPRKLAARRAADGSASLRPGTRAAAQRSVARRSGAVSRAVPRKPGPGRVCPDKRERRIARQQGREVAHGGGSLGQIEAAAQLPQRAAGQRRRLGGEVNARRERRGRRARERAPAASASRSSRLAATERSSLAPSPTRSATTPRAGEPPSSSARSSATISPFAAVRFRWPARLPAAREPATRDCVLAP